MVEWIGGGLVADWWVVGGGGSVLTYQKTKFWIKTIIMQFYGIKLKFDSSHQGPPNSKTIHQK